MWYDIVVLMILVWFTARGASRGLIWQLASIVGIVLCLMFSETFAAVVGPHVTLDPPYNEWVVLFGAYLFFTFVAFGAARLVNHGIEKVAMKEFDRHLGAVFGFIKGTVLCLVLTFFIATLPSLHDTIKSSKSGRLAARAMNKLHPTMPPRLHDALQKYIHSLDDVPVDEPLFQGENGEIDPLVKVMKDAAGALKNHGNDLAKDVIPRMNRSGWEDSEEEPISPVASPSTTQEPAPRTAPFANTRSSIPSRPGSTTGTPTVEPRNSIPGAASTASHSTPGSTFWAEVRGVLGREAQNVLVETMENMDPQTQAKLQADMLEILKNTRSEKLPQLQDQLIQAGSTALPSLISTLEKKLPTSQGGSMTNATAERERLLTEISQLRSSFPQVQSRIQSEVRGLVAGVPETVVLRVLRDWKADLNHDPQDPDEGTDADTPIETRILRQMEFAGQRLDQLDRALQERLSTGAETGVQLR